MPKELLILRHGKSDWNSHGSDFDRPLKNRGKRGAQRVGAWLWQQDLRPDIIISSPAERAITTAHKCCKAMGFGVNKVMENESIYAASRAELLSVLASVDGLYDRIMLVGHNPGLEDLLSFLASSVPLPRDGKLLPTATLAYLNMPNNWQTLEYACATLDQIVRGRDLPHGFHYPAPAGDEIRERPAYYYTQSAVIPYRLDSGRFEFLLIGSSKKQRWVVPKGIKEPGLTAQQSAAKEAWEEAGIRGEVNDQLLGQYLVQKWGAQCKVDVYAMRVTEVVDEHQWKESHRTRRWMDPDQAIKCLEQPELGAMLSKLSILLQD